MIKILDALCEAGGARNEDLIRYDEKNVLVLDGSTGLRADAPDACWFTENFADAFMGLIRRTDDLCASVEQALEEVRRQFFRECRDPCADGVFPSASAVIAHQSGDLLQILNVGDCTTVLFEKEKTSLLYSEEVDRFDGAVIAELQKERQRTRLDIADLVKTDRIRGMLLENRKKMNAPDGYEILAFNMPKRTPSHLLQIDRAQLRQVVMLTDGFRPCLEALKTLPCPSLRSLYESLRQTEREDPGMNQRPRFKISDDASAIVFEVQ